MARLGSGDEALDVFHMLNPVNHTRSQGDAEHYQIEPYVVAGDVSSPASQSGYAGRGGWSWYTGSAGWMYRAGLESILGLRRRGPGFEIDPCIPSSWPEYRIVWRLGRTRYEISVRNPDGRCRGVRKAVLDGQTVDPQMIPIVEDGEVHRVALTLGKEGDPDVRISGSTDITGQG